MDELVKLAKDSIKYYLEYNNYLDKYDDNLKDNNNGVIISVNVDGNIERSGSLYPTRANIALDVIYEAVNLVVFKNKLDLNVEDVDDIDLSVYEITKVQAIQYIEDFGVYDGITLNYKNNSAVVFRSDYESDYQMFEDAIAIANVDSYDIFNIEKFKLKRHIV